MIGSVLKNWKSILDIILVIALVLLFFIWNPFGIFGGGLKLAPTANMVTEIREMGQLVTSEYYGEVIASIPEARLNYLEEDEIAEKASILFDKLSEAMLYLKDFQEKPAADKEAAYKLLGPVDGWRKIILNDVNRRNIVDKLNYHNLLEDFSSEPLYEDVLEHIWKKENSNKAWKGTSRQKEEALNSLYSEVKDDQALSLEEAPFIQFYYQKKESALPRKEAKKKLAMVGRGWVKAGFDFSKVDNNNFYINEDAGEVHFFGISAVILNSDINPWFIPEQGIPGFEILDYNGKVDFKDAKKVKQYCIEKLVVKAREADIISHAELNGAETLKNLFSLMTGKEIKKVFFHNDKIIRLSQEIASDEYVNYQEAVLLDTQIKNEWEAIDSLRNTRENSYKNSQLAQHREENIKVVLQRLRQLPFEDIPGSFNECSIKAYEIAEDSILDDGEWEILETMRFPSALSEQRHQTRSPELFIEEYLTHATNYNIILDYLMSRGVITGSVADTTLFKATFTEDFMANHRVMDYGYINPELLQVCLFIEEQVPHQMFLDLLYPFNFTKNTWDQIISKEHLVLDDVPWNQELSFDFNDSTSWIYEKKPFPHFKLLNIPLHELMNPLILERYSGQELIWISEDLCFVNKRFSLDSLKTEAKPMITAMQSKEMENFYRFLLDSHIKNKNKGPIIRANEWIQKKFENNTPVRVWFSELKNKFSDQMN